MSEIESGLSAEETGEIQDNRREVDPESVKCLQVLVEQLQQERDEYRQERDEYRRQARTDELTNLPNRRAFDESLKEVLGKANIFLVLVDVDKLKDINDRYGHKIGDKAIKRVAKVLVEATRENSDIVARIGGDEFVIIGACSSGTQVEQIVPSLRQRIDPKLAESGKGLKGMKLEVSMGAAVARKGETITTEKLEQKADQNMYEDKRSKNGD